MSEIWKPRRRVNKSFTELTSILKLNLEDRVRFHHSKKGKECHFKSEVCREAGMKVLIPVPEMRSRPKAWRIVFGQRFSGG